MTQGPIEQEWTIDDILEVLPKTPHKLDALVVAYMAKRVIEYKQEGGTGKERGNTHFSVHDITRILCRIYTRDNVYERLRGDTRIQQMRNQPAESYLALLQRHFQATGHSAQVIEELIIPRSGRNLQGQNTDLAQFGRKVNWDADFILRALLDQRKPYLDRADILKSGGPRGFPYAYRFVLRE